MQYGIDRLDGGSCVAQVAGGPWRPRDSARERPVRPGGGRHRRGPGFVPLSFSRVTFLSAVGAIGATAVFAGFVRYANRPGRTFVRIAAALLLVSLLPDVALLSNDPAATVAGVVVLMALHVVAAAAVALLVYGDEPPRQAAAEQSQPYA